MSVRYLTWLLAGSVTVWVRANPPLALERAPNWACTRAAVNWLR
jgi:hypothetical protein